MTSLRMLLMIGALAGLSACTTEPKPPAPVQIKTVIEKVPVPCEPHLPEAPQYSDSADALGAASDILEKVKLLLIGREQRQGREEALTAALKACAAPVIAPAP